MKKYNGNVTELRPGDRNIYIIHNKKPVEEIESPLITQIHKDIDKKPLNSIDKDVVPHAE